jgi:hypothetical protein
MKRWVALGICIVLCAAPCLAEEDLLQASTILGRYYSNGEMVRSRCAIGSRCRRQPTPAERCSRGLNAAPPAAGGFPPQIH